jgi:type I restriction enzyme R subunit
MAKQPEAVLEEQLVEQLQKLGYGLAILKDETELVANLKQQLEKTQSYSILR